MTSSTIFNSSNVTREAFEAQKHELLERPGQSRRAIRYELSNVIPLDYTDRYVEHEPDLYVNEETQATGFGPTSVGQFETQNRDFIQGPSRTIDTYRYVDGWKTDIEDLESGAIDPERQRQTVMSSLSFQFDLGFLNGVSLPDGKSELVKGVLQHMSDAIPSERTFDCSLYAGGESGDTADYDGVERNLLVDASAEISGQLMGSSKRW